MDACGTSVDINVILAVIKGGSLVHRSGAPAPPLTFFLAKGRRDGIAARPRVTFEKS
jgi:hypothetical protein